MILLLSKFKPDERGEERSDEWGAVEFIE